MTNDEKALAITGIAAVGLALIYLVKRPVTSIAVHPHGPHDCYCPACGYILTVDTNIKCNTLQCPQCNDRMRAVETGEYRGAI